MAVLVDSILPEMGVFALADRRARRVQPDVAIGSDA